MDMNALLAVSQTRRRLPEPAMRRLLRQRARLSQAEVAAAAGVARATVSRWESGAREPSGERLAAYVAILDRLAAA